MTRRTRLGAQLSALIACCGWTALAIELAMSLERSQTFGIPLSEAVYLYLRYFTILTNIGTAALMSVSALRLARGAPLPPVGFYNAALAYLAVMCATYEGLLRRLWSPRGIQFVTDMTMHDVVPALTLLFWLGFVLGGRTRWRDTLWLLAYPAAYLAATLVAGALGAGYPYDFLDPGVLGPGGVTVVAAVFLVAFAGLGLAATAASRFWARHPVPMDRLGVSPQVLR